MRVGSEWSDRSDNDGLCGPWATEWLQHDHMIVQQQSSTGVQAFKKNNRFLINKKASVWFNSFLTGDSSVWCRNMTRLFLQTTHGESWENTSIWSRTTAEQENTILVLKYHWSACSRCFLLQHTWIKSRDHWQSCAHLDAKRMRWSIHLNQVCLYGQTPKTSTASVLEDQDGETAA